MVTKLASSGKKLRGIGDQPRKDAIDFLAVGIDDLAKYRIVQLLYDNPEICWDVRQYAQSLGLRSFERTLAELEELTRRRILELHCESGQPRYKLTADRRVRRYLEQLFALAQGPLRGERIIRLLAARSLERAKVCADGKRRTNP